VDTFKSEFIKCQCYGEGILSQEDTDKIVSFLNKNRDGFPTGNVDFGTSME